MTAWGREDDPEDAGRRILDAAGQVFAERGVAGASMGDVARQAGCSRGTVYRYFPDRDALRRAFVEREADRVGAAVALRITDVDDPGSRLVEAVSAAVAEVRGDPRLWGWFAPDASGTAGAVARSGDAVAGLVDTFLADLFAEADRRGILREGIDRSLATDWVVRSVLSLLTHPADDATTRSLLESFLVPALFSGR